MSILENRSASPLPASAEVVPREITTTPRFSDRVFKFFISGFGAISVLILTVIGGFLAYRGLTTFKTEGFGFITGYDWKIEIDEVGNQTSSLGIGAMLVGTLLISLVALIVGVPISVLCALYLTFYAPVWIKNILISIIDLMAAFPSILFGMWGYFVLMPSAQYWAKLLHEYLGWIPIFDVTQPLFTRSPFVAGLVLAVMIIPIVTSISREIFAQAPLDRVQAAYALGANKWAMIKAVVLPFGANGVVGGAMLGLGRAFGETVAVFSVLSIVYKANLHILFGAGGNVASHIILNWGDASEYETGALLAAGFILFLLTLAVNMLANYVVKKSVKKGR